MISKIFLPTKKGEKNIRCFCPYSRLLAVLVKDYLHAKIRVGSYTVKADGKKRALIWEMKVREGDIDIRCPSCGRWHHFRIIKEKDLT